MYITWYILVQQSVPAKRVADLHGPLEPGEASQKTYRKPEAICDQNIGICLQDRSPILGQTTPQNGIAALKPPRYFTVIAIAIRTRQ